LSERIGNLKFLSFLSLVNSSLTNITRTLQILSTSRSLTTLFLGFNFMHETMPDDYTVDGFENLQVLALNDCSLSGHIPHWLSKLTNLRMLFLLNNQLSEPIPDWISNLNFLFCLDISNNSLTGIIPSALMDMPMLRSDKIAPNVFELPVYNKISSLQYLRPGAFPKVLNLGKNNFSGVIPKDIGKLQTLLSLNLSSNELSGEIPQSLCTLKSLQVLDLSNNRLTGKIPAALNSLHFLSRFNISNNDLEGPIPTAGQLSTFPDSSFDGNLKLCGPMIVNHCSLTEEGTVSLISTKEIGTKVIFAIAFGAFFIVGVLYDQIVLSKYFG
jgi:Leucine-rich repeat (LRR) protein